MAAPRIDLAAIAGVRPSDRRQRLRTIGQLIQNAWKVEASELRTFKTAYVKNIVLDEITDQSVRVVLNGTVPNMVEQGMGPGGVGTEGPYDIRRFVLKPGTRRLRRGKKGMYVNIPFGHSEADIRAIGGAEAVRAARGLDATRSRMDLNAVRASVRANGRSEFFARHPGSVVWGGRLGGGAPARLQGLVRYDKTYAAATQSKPYATWRRMSEGGLPWMHPGLKGKHFARRVLARVPQIVAMVS